MIVADTNLLSYLHLPGTQTARVERVLARDPLWVAPVLWRSEFRNVLATLVRARRLPFERALDAVEAAERQMQGREYRVDSRPVLELARDSGCTAYDCEFVSLARHLETKLVTTDGELRSAFPDTAISPEDFIA